MIREVETAIMAKQRYDAALDALETHGWEVGKIAPVIDPVALLQVLRLAGDVHGSSGDGD